MVSTTVNNEVWIRLGEVRRLTGWDPKYIRKLRLNGVLDTWRPFPGAYAWYRKSQILKMLQTR